MMPDETGAEAMAQILLRPRKWKRGELRRNPPDYGESFVKAGGGTEPSQQCIWRWAEAWAWWDQCLWEDDEETYPMDIDQETNGYYAWGRAKRTTDPLKVAAAVGAQAVHLTKSYAPFCGDVERVEEWLEENMTGDKSVATAKAYGGAWAKWCAWAKRQGWVDEFLNRNIGPIENENRVLAYVGYLGWLGASPNTIRQHIFAMKTVH